MKAAHEAAHVSNDELEPAVCSLYSAVVGAYGTWWYSLMAKHSPVKEEYMEGLSYIYLPVLQTL